MSEKQRPRHRLYLSTQQSGAVLLLWGPYDPATKSLAHSTDAVIVAVVPEEAYATLDEILDALDFGDGRYPSQLHTGAWSGSGYVVYDDYGEVAWKPAHQQLPDRARVLLAARWDSGAQVWVRVPLHSMERRPAGQAPGFESDKIEAKLNAIERACEAAERLSEDADLLLVD